MEEKIKSMLKSIAWSRTKTKAVVIIVSSIYLGVLLEPFIYTFSNIFGLFTVGAIAYFGLRDDETFSNFFFFSLIASAAVAITPSLFF